MVLAGLDVLAMLWKCACVFTRRTLLLFLSCMSIAIDLYAVSS